MQILELVGRSKDGLKHLDIAKALNIPKGSLSLLLSDLVGSEFLTIGEDDKRYRVGHKIIVLAGRYSADLAFYSREEIDRYLSTAELIPITRYTIKDKEILRRELEATRNGAIAYSREENYEGITSMAVPVFNNMKRVVASLGTPVPSQRFAGEKEKVIGKALWEAAGLLSRELGYF